MFAGWMNSLMNLNGITILIMCILALSLLQGWWRGASRSAGALLHLVVDGILTIAALFCAVGTAMWLSPYAADRLQAYTAALPAQQLSSWQEIYYTIVSAIANFPLLRFGILFLISYMIIRGLLRLASDLLISRKIRSHAAAEGRPGLVSRLAGAGIGTLIGAARAIFVIALLFVGVSLYPNSSFSSYIQSSPVYKQGAQSVIEPLSGTFVKDKLPVFTQAVEKEMNGILQQKYDIIDRHISSDIQQAAAQVAGTGGSDEEKARRLYDWVGSRISYDYDKVTNYEERGIWHEQNPQETFTTRKGVCIDYARLYAMMARSVGLDVRVVTGLGYNGQGGYGPHAWNEVYLSQSKQWVPLDPTWKQSGDWFNPPNFAQTHIKNQTV
ncbi:transglutaminase domain-containing protein [Paenibacillus sp. JX-17]|uniref:Transglutaminase domain-containing protein n=1 Tax=Paenibacillus lacisoli TaxID=3064525 RepID=A0ABT9CCU1_9BACL|nr:transglutaminase domain-containing protein [Paenibacillus sp. JX-17]MDO7907080.1 transglutaminase domain-containing protein [Paenibacillus sp. JX-17]